MDALKTHQFYFDKQINALYVKFTKICIPENYFDRFEIQKFTFSFGGYITYFYFNELNRLLYHSKPQDILFMGNLEEFSFDRIPVIDDPQWLEVVEKIEQYAVTGEI